MSINNENYPAYLFHQGTNYYAYRYMGVHFENMKFAFRVWAPHAQEAYVVGDFNNWTKSDKMQKITDSGIWELFVDSDRIKDGCQYKFLFENNGREIYKADPYAFKTEKSPGTASCIDISEKYSWHDEGWLSYRSENFENGFYEKPINIYELHMGSWKRHEDGSYLTYRELAKELSFYVKKMGYTHVEIMPIAEYPFDGSWGYQGCSYYAPTSRYGIPQDFKFFVDSMHSAGIGVILDWVPGHFPKDAHGLYEFDGDYLYEYQGADRMEHREWGTRKFDIARNEVECFLISNAIFWIEEYHIDGIRVDAVSSMLYLDYDKKPGEWFPNIYGNNISLEGVAFFKKLNSVISGSYPDVLMIAEESSSWKGLTDNCDNGLGFSMKWNMGWMNDTLKYCKIDPIFRKHHHDYLTFSLSYAFDEKFVLPISHDEVVHGKLSFLNKMPGDYWQKFASARAFAAYMITHPGKKLMFMGCEIGQFKEWDYNGSVEWFLLDYESHARFQLYMSALNHLYLRLPQLWQLDKSWDGFRWIDPDNKDSSVISFRRFDKNGEEITVIINFTPVVYENFKIGVEKSGVYEEIFNSDSEEYGGSGVVNKNDLQSTPQEYSGLSNSIVLRLPPLAATILKRKNKN